MNLDKSTFHRYQEELAQSSPNDFRIGPAEESASAPRLRTSASVAVLPDPLTH